MRFLGLGNGKDGIIALGSYTQTWITCSGTSGSTSLTATGSFSPGDRLFIHQTRGTNAGLGEDNTVLSYSSGTITLVHPLERTYADSGASQAQVAVVKEASAVSGTLTLPAWDGNVGGGFVIACSGLFSGQLIGTGKGFLGAAASAQNTDGEQGEGSAAARGTTARTANGNGGGGGTKGTNANHSGGGGGGAGGVAGTVGMDDGGLGGAGGTVIVSTDLTTILPGGGGGSGATNTSQTAGGGAGGNGGGFAIIYSAFFTPTTQIIMGGANGTVLDAFGEGGGGGGGGGSILVRTKSATLGSNILTAPAGSGAGVNAAGGAGGAGQIRIEACSLTGTTSPTASTQVGGHAFCGTNVALL